MLNLFIQTPASFVHMLTVSFSDVILEFLTKSYWFLIQLKVFVSVQQGRRERLILHFFVLFFLSHLLHHGNCLWLLQRGEKNIGGWDNFPLSQAVIIRSALALSGFDKFSQFSWELGNILTAIPFPMSPSIRLYTPSAPPMMHKLPACPNHILMPPVCLECWSSTSLYPRWGRGTTASVGIKSITLPINLFLTFNLSSQAWNSISGSSPISRSTVLLWGWFSESSQTSMVV